MKQIKRLLVMTVLAVSMLCASASAVYFWDVKPNNWAIKEISWAVNQGMMNGTSEKTFSPDKDTLRAQMAAILYRYAGSPAVSGEIPYTDVKAGTWYTDAAIWAKDNGIFTSDKQSAAALNPDDAIGRAEFCTMLYHFAELTGNDSKTGSVPFTDTASLSGEYQTAIAWAYSNGIVNGVSAAAFAPNDTLTRAQAAAMLYRYHSRFTDGAEQEEVILLENSKQADENELIQLINDYRAENGLPRLNKNDTLMKAAAIRAKEAAFNFSHYRPDGTIGSTVLLDMGVTNLDYAWENLYGDTGAWNAFKAWKNSYGHNATMLTPDPVTEIGVASYADDNGHSAYVMAFGEYYS